MSDDTTCAACGKATTLVNGICARCTRDSRPNAGAVGWNYRRPRKVGNATHWMGIEMGSEVHYQRSPPVHCNGAAPRLDSDDEHLLPREVSENEAARRLRKDAAAATLGALVTPGQLDAIRLRHAGLGIAAIAAKLRISEPAVKERLKRGAAAIRRHRA